jgi:hypothetical protein
MGNQMKPTIITAADCPKCGFRIALVNDEESAEVKRIAELEARLDESVRKNNRLQSALKSCASFPCENPGNDLHDCPSCYARAALAKEKL